MKNKSFRYVDPIQTARRQVEDFKAADNAKDRWNVALDPPGGILPRGMNEQERAAWIETQKSKRKKERTGMKKSGSTSKKMNCGGKTKKMASGGSTTCRGMGAAKKGGKFSRNG